MTLRPMTLRPTTLRPMTFRLMTLRPMTLRPAASLALAAGLLAAGAFVLPGCDRGRDARAEAAAPGAAETPPRPLPRYAFAPGLREQYPDVAAFVVQFLETCLANDYAGYRTMVSRRFEPESPQRFAAIYNAIRAVEVHAIEPIELGALPAPTYRIVSAIELDPKQPVAVRGPNRKIAILVFKEEGRWVMVPAPPRLQPAPETPTSAPASGPAETTQPDYPWDEYGDD